MFMHMFFWKSLHLMPTLICANESRNVSHTVAFGSSLHSADFSLTPAVCTLAALMVGDLLCFDFMATKFPNSLRVGLLHFSYEATSKFAFSMFTALL